MPAPIFASTSSYYSTSTSRTKRPGAHRRRKAIHPSRLGGALAAAFAAVTMGVLGSTGPASAATSPSSSPSPSGSTGASPGERAATSPSVSSALAAIRANREEWLQLEDERFNLLQGLRHQISPYSAFQFSAEVRAAWSRLDGAQAAIDEASKTGTWNDPLNAVNDTLGGAVIASNAGIKALYAENNRLLDGLEAKGVNLGNLRTQFGIGFRLAWVDAPNKKHYSHAAVDRLNKATRRLGVLLSADRAATLPKPTPTATNPLPRPRPSGTPGVPGPNTTPTPILQAA